MNSVDFDLNLLRAFDAMMKHRNVTRAGSAVGLSQPAMSHALSRLRRAFRDPLFVRGAGCMTPTARAERVYPGLRTAILQIEGTLDGSEDFVPARASRTFTMAVAENAAFYILPILLRRLHREAPDVELRVLSTASVPGFQLVTDGSADLSIGLLPSRPPKDLAFKALFREETVCLARRGHPAFVPKLTLKKFLAYPHVTALPSVTVTNPVETMLGKLGCTRKIIVGVPHFLMIPFLLSETDYIATIGGRMAQHFAPMLNLETRKLPFPLSPNKAFLAWHRRFDQDSGHRWLREIIISESASI